MFTHTPNDPIFDMVTASTKEVSHVWNGAGSVGPFDDGTPICYPHWMVSTPFGDGGVAWLEWEGEKLSEMRTVCIAAVEVPVSDALFRFVATEARESSWANLHLRWNEESDIAAVVVASSIWSGMLYGITDNRALDASIYNALMGVFGWGKNWGEQILDEFGGRTWHWDGSDQERQFMRMIGIGLL